MKGQTMNFQAVRNGNEQNIAMSGILASLDGITYTTNGAPKQRCKITDANQEAQFVTIYQGNGLPIPDNKISQTLSFNISYKMVHGKGYYGGFWNSTAQVAPLSQTPPSQPPQVSQNAPQAANGRNKSNGQPDWDAIAEGKVRHGIVIAGIESGQIALGPKNLIGDILYWQEFIMTGKAPLPPARGLGAPLIPEEMKESYDQRN
jgi:hypothetical protein